MIMKKVDDVFKTKLQWIGKSKSFDGTLYNKPSSTYSPNLKQSSHTTTQKADMTLGCQLHEKGNIT